MLLNLLLRLLHLLLTVCQIAVEGPPVHCHALLHLRLLQGLGLSLVLWLLKWLRLRKSLLLLAGDQLWLTITGLTITGLTVNGLTVNRLRVDGLRIRLLGIDRLTVNRLQVHWLRVAVNM